MRWGFEGAGEALRSPIPWVALTATLALSAVGWIGLERSRSDEARSQFDRRTATAEAAIRSRMLSYEQALRAGAARIASAPSVTRREYRDFITQLGLEERFPGIQSIGFAERVKASQRDAHAKRMRAEGFPDYEIRPTGERDEMFPTVFNEPFLARNARFIGFDAYSEPTRRAAMDRARDNADTAITAKLALIGDAYRGTQPQQPGFVMYIAVFDKDVRTLGPAERDAALRGFVFSPFRVHELMRGILDEGVLQVLDMQVYDGPSMSPESELIDTRTAWRVTAADSVPTFSRQVSFPMPGRLWTIRLISRPE